MSTLHVFVVDDDESVRTALCSLVRSVGLVPHTCASVDAFLAADGLAQADCIITDVHMPDIDGEQFQKCLAEKGCTTPLIVMTAFPDLRLRDRVMAAGAHCFLSKPFDAEEMIRCIERALQIDAR